MFRNLLNSLSLNASSRRPSCNNARVRVEELEPRALLATQLFPAVAGLNGMEWEAYVNAGAIKGFEDHDLQDNLVPFTISLADRPSAAILHAEIILEIKSNGGLSNTDSLWLQGANGIDVDVQNLSGNAGEYRTVVVNLGDFLAPSPEPIPRQIMFGDSLRGMVQDDSAVRSVTLHLTYPDPPVEPPVAPPVEAPISSPTAPADASPAATLMFQLLEGQRALVLRIGRLSKTNPPTRRLAIQGLKLLNSLDEVAAHLIRTTDVNRDPQFDALAEAYVDLGSRLRRELARVDRAAVNRQLSRAAQNPSVQNLVSGITTEVLTQKLKQVKRHAENLLIQTEALLRNAVGVVFRQ